jgi:hypothetical protein
MRDDLIMHSRYISCRHLTSGELFFLKVDHDGDNVVAGWEVDREGQILRVKRYHIVEKKLIMITEYRQSRKYGTLERMPDTLV